MSKGDPKEIKVVSAGDLALTQSLDDGEFVRRSDIINGDAFTRNVFADDVQHAKEPTTRFAIFWHRQSDDEYSEDELDSITEAGYRPVTAVDAVETGDFHVRRWKRSPEGYVQSGRYIMYWLPENLYNERVNKKLKHLGLVLDSGVSEFHDRADKMGLGTFESRGGRHREVVRGKSRIDIS
jgi:hypothetical protein